MAYLLNNILAKLQTYAGYVSTKLIHACLGYNVVGPTYNVHVRGHVTNMQQATHYCAFSVLRVNLYRVKADHNYHTIIVFISYWPSLHLRHNLFTELMQLLSSCYFTRLSLYIHFCRPYLFIEVESLIINRKLKVSKTF